MVWLLMRFDFVMNRWLVKLIWCCIILCLLSCVFVCFVLISVMIVLSRKLLVILLLMKNVCVMGFGFVRLVVLIMMWLKLSLFLCFFVVRLLSVWVRLLWIVQQMQLLFIWMICLFEFCMRILLLMFFLLNLFLIMVIFMLCCLFRMCLSSVVLLLLRKLVRMVMGVVMLVVCGL